MEENQETDSTLLVSDLNDISINDLVANKSNSDIESESISLVQENSCDNLFEQLKENKKHIFVFSSAGKPIYTR